MFGSIGSILRIANKIGGILLIRFFTLVTQCGGSFQYRHALPGRLHTDGLENLMIKAGEKIEIDIVFGERISMLP